MIMLGVRLHERDFTRYSSLRQSGSHKCHCLGVDKEHPSSSPYTQCIFLLYVAPNFAYSFQLFLFIVVNISLSCTLFISPYLSICVSCYAIIWVSFWNWANSQHASTVHQFTDSIKQLLRTTKPFSPSA